MGEQGAGAGEHSARRDRCSRPNCFAPETACNLGSELADCPFFGRSGRGAVGVVDPEGIPSAQERDYERERVADFQREHVDSAPLPWTGNSLGTIDLEFLSARSNPRILGLVGNQNAGKTTLLTVLYLLLHAGGSPSARQFCGSFTLGGWEALSQHLRWSGVQGLTFPPHTPRGLRRMPGLLHLAFRHASPSADGCLKDSYEDVLLTDPPGEWFGAWTVDRDAASAEGARWIATNADAFAFLVDSEALAGPERGNAREQVLRLSQRLGECVRGRRVAVIWTKADVPVRDSIRTAINEALDRDLPGHRSFSVQVPLLATSQLQHKREASITPDTADTLLKLLTWLLDATRSLSGRGFEVDIESELRRSLLRPVDPFIAGPGITLRP
jgi:hypothetical protein